MRKFESSQKDESRAQLADSSKAYKKRRAFIDLRIFRETTCFIQSWFTFWKAIGIIKDFLHVLIRNKHKNIISYRLLGMSQTLNNFWSVFIAIDLNYGLHRLAFWLLKNRSITQLQPGKGNWWSVEIGLYFLPFRP